MRFARWIEEYIRYIEGEKGLSRSTVENYDYELRRLLLFLEGNGVSPFPGDVGPSHIQQYIAFLEGERRYKPSSVKRVTSIIRSFFGYLEMEGAFSFMENPARDIPSIKVQRDLPQVLSLKESRQFLARIKFVSSYPARDYAIFLLFLQTCCRLQELQQLTTGSIDLQDRWVELTGTQGNRRRLSLTREACSALLDYLEIRQHVAASDQLFLSPGGSPMSKSGISGLFKSLAKKTGIFRPGLSVHKLRHTCLALKFQEGMNLGRLQEIAGHASPSSTTVYKHIVEGQKAKEGGMSSVGEG